jgi:long-chain acyl-CoA synthetase
MIEAINGSVNIPDITIYSLLQKNAEVNGSRPVMIFYEKYITYSKMLKYVDSMAYQLEKLLNIKKGDTIGIIMDFSPQYVISVISSLKIGARILIMDENADDGTINEYKNKYGIKVIIISKKFINKANIPEIKYIVSDPNDFLTLGKVIINNIRHRSNIKYGNNILKFYEFIYSENSSNNTENPNYPHIMFISGNKLLVFSVKNVIASTFILNYWMPKIEGMPQFYSSISPSTPLGLIYSITLPISFSGTMVIAKFNGVFKNNPDFIVGDPAFYSALIEKRANIIRVKYCIMPFFDAKTEINFNEFTKIPMITGRSDQCTLTTHINPFDDIRKGSFGMPLNYVECRINDENELLVKTPYLPTIYEKEEKKSFDWINTRIKVKVKDNYYYAL